MSRKVSVDDESLSVTAVHDTYACGELMVSVHA